MKLKRILPIFSVLFLFTVSAKAETLIELQKELLQKNPEIIAARNRYFAAKKFPIQEGTLPDPTVSFTDFGVGHPFSALNESDFAYRALGFSQGIPFPGKLALKSKIAEKAVEREQQELRQTAIRLLSQLKSSFVESVYLQKAIEIAEKYRDLLNDLAEITEARYRVGEGLQQDVLRAQVERSVLEEKLELLRQELESEKASLKALLNRDSTPSLSAAALLPQPSFNTSFEELKERLRTRSPEVLNKIKQQEQRELQLRLAKKELYPDFAANFQWQRTGSNFSDYYMTMFEVRIPLYSWRKQKPAIAQASLELTASQNDTKATLLQLEAELKDAFLTATTTANLIKLYNEGIIPQTRLSLESAVASYRVGKIEFISLLNNATTLLNYESEYFRRNADHVKAIARIEELTGILLQPQELEVLQEFENE